MVHGMVKEVRETEVELRSGDTIPYGLCVWSTGVGALALPRAHQPERAAGGTASQDQRPRHNLTFNPYPSRPKVDLHIVNKTHDGLCAWSAWNDPPATLTCIGHVEASSAASCCQLWLALKACMPPVNGSALAGPTAFTTSLPFARTPRGRIAIDDRLRVLTHPHNSDVGPAHPSEARPRCPETTPGSYPLWGASTLNLFAC